MSSIPKVAHERDGSCMVAANSRMEKVSLRQVLKTRTQSLHERLDASVGASASDPRDYGVFLGIQYAARKPIERWVAANLPQADRPPQSSDLIAGDLAALGLQLPAEEQFTMPASADWRGLAWTIGGSSLGNRAMLLQRRRAGLTGADSFLSDGETAAYFRALLPQLAQPADPADADAAVAAAEAVFETFLRANARMSAIAPA